MKMKQLIVLMIFACVLLMTAHEAQAFYNPSTGRWLSRDPLPGRRDVNLFALTRNSPVNAVDYLGLDSLSTCQSLADAANSGNPKARSSKECCEEMVVAEQTGIDDCSQKCGKYPGDPTKVPGFKGDFSSLEDRIKYGKKWCCEKSSEGNKKGSQRASQ